MAIVAPPMAEVKAALRLDPGSAYDAILSPLVAAAVERANRQAPDAPAAMGRLAVFQAVGWLFEYGGGTDYGANWWTRSGAGSTLKPWTVRRAGLIG